MIHIQQQDQHANFCFHRINDATGHINPESILIDDRQLYIHQRRERLSLT